MKNRMFASAIASAAFGALLMAVGTAHAKDVAISLTGDQQSPPVMTKAKGEGKITIADDKSVSGSVKTTGVMGTAAHIHQATADSPNGPPIIVLEKKGDSEWAVPAGAKLTDAQLEAFKAGKLYVNVHSAEHKPGEIRGTLKP
jgi:hypothetical protein